MPNNTSPPGMTVSRNTDILHAYMSGETLEQIGRTHGITRERVRQILAKNGINRRSTGESVSLKHARIADARRDDILAAYRTHGTVLSVIEEFSGQVPSRVVRDVLSEVSVAQRYRSRAPRKRAHTDQSMLAALVRAQDAGATTIKEYTDWRATEGDPDIPSVPLLVMRYGSWRGARAAAGLTTVSTGGDRKSFTDDELYDAVKRFVAACEGSGTYPSARAYADWSKNVGNVPRLSTVRSRTNRRWVDLVDQQGGRP